MSVKPYIGLFMISIICFKEILTSSCLVLSVLVIFIDLRTTNAYQSYDMNEECSNTIAVEENGGELHLDSSKMSRNRMPTGKCTISIKPRRYQDVMFYFTEFSVGLNDTKTNVSIRGARSALPELPNDLNGNIRSLINPVRLFEVKDSMSVTYQTSFAGGDISRFLMKFIYLGNCQRFKYLWRCDNGNCVSEGVYCNTTLYACGTGPNECPDDTELNPASYLFYTCFSVLVIAGVCVVLFRWAGKVTRCSAGGRNSNSKRDNQREAAHNSDNISMPVPDNVEATERLSLSAHEANGDTNIQPDDQFDSFNTMYNHDILNMTSFVSSLDDVTSDNASLIAKIGLPMLTPYGTNRKLSDRYRCENNVTPDNAKRTVNDDHAERESCMALVPYYMPNQHVIDYKFIPD